MGKYKHFSVFAGMMIGYIAGGLSVVMTIALGGTVWVALLVGGGMLAIYTILLGILKA